MTRITRRDFFVSLAAMLGGLLLPSPGPVAGEAPGNLAGRLLNILVTDIAAAGRLGRAYLVTHPAERDLQRLVDGVLDTLRLPRGSNAFDFTPGAELVAGVRRAVIDDYLAGRVVDIDGWVLSITEARLYALAALADGSLR